MMWTAGQWVARSSAIIGQALITGTVLLLLRALLWLKPTTGCGHALASFGERSAFKPRVADSNLRTEHACMWKKLFHAQTEHMSENTEALAISFQPSCVAELLLKEIPSRPTAHTGWARFNSLGLRGSLPRPLKRVLVRMPCGHGQNGAKIHAHIR